MTHVSFDLETTGIDVDSDSIVCGATRMVTDNGLELKLWHSDYADVMSKETATELANYLIAAHETGTAVVSFNGAKFDFAILARHLNPEDRARLQKVARGHFDIMLDFACARGYYASMDSFAKGCGLSPKTWNGLEASNAWIANQPGDRERVVSYCGEDVRVLSELYDFIVCNGYALRTTKAGREQRIEFLPLREVADALSAYAKDPPDCSWMTSPAPVMSAGLAWLT